MEDELEQVRLIEQTFLHSDTLDDVNNRVLEYDLCWTLVCRRVSRRGVGVDRGSRSSESA